VASDPKVARAGVDPGYKLDDGTLRAPDVAILPADAGRGWIPGAPGLAFEYAGEGQDEAELRKKIAELLGAGTEYLWVVRLVGPRRVEAWEKGQYRLAVEGDLLEAPEYLQNPIPVSALFDDAQARELQLRNLLQRHGYLSLEEAVARSRQEGHAEGRQEGRQEGEASARAAATSGLRDALLAALSARGLPVDDDARSRVTAASYEQLLGWIVRAATAPDAASATRD
jgi:hypothetical protein